ncbi:hypothetical protein [Streptomyces albogriseolus]|uniref:Flagellin-like hook-associated protein FlgL n=1 Tax=Streptomyces albogriseolus TaxID=1887 RepID=A0ACC6UL50_STRAO|nr:hypothetical protein [Streptomyces viridodiastaticus]MCX4566978.1 hypothetical protein [Streptomyces viridodiastaticus]GHG03884.1 hypothetical protein GCM10018777_14010 [Streptomyces viridodiastaticus]
MRALPARRIALGALCAALLVTTTGPAALAADSHPGQEPAASLLARLPQTDTARTDLTPVTDLVRAVLSAPDGQLPPAEARRLAAAAREAVARAATDDPSSASVTVVNDSSTLAAPVLPGVPNPATGVLLPTAEEDDTPAATTDSVLGAVREALENFLNVLLPQSDPADADSASTAATESSSTSTTETDDTGTTGTTDGTSTTDEVTAAVNASETAAGAAADAALTATDALVARVDELLAALAGTDAQTATTLPAPADPVASSDSATPVEPAASPGLLPALTSLLTPNS